jgi:hypothetical protein
MACNNLKASPAEVIEDIKEVLKDADGFVAPSLTVLKDLELLVPTKKDEIEKVIKVITAIDGVLPLVENFLDELAKVLGK